MNTLLSIFIIFLSVSTTYGQGSVKPKLELVRNFDPCDENPRITLLLKIGTVEISDSFFGFDYIIEYDTSKVQYNAYYKTNTMMNLFQVDYTNGDKEMSEVFGGGGVHGSKPIIGNGDLVGIGFNYIADDFTSTTFKIKNMIMTDEYTKEIDLSDNVFEFSPVIKELPNRNLTLSSGTSEVKIDSSLESTIYLNSQIYNDNRLNNFDLILKYNKNHYSIDLKSNENYTIQNIEDNINSSVFRINSENFSSKDSSLYLHIYQNSELEDELTSELEVLITDWERKSCITNTKSDVKISLTTFKEKEEIGNVVKLIDDNFDKIIIIYDLLGNIVFKKNENERKNPELKNGLYFLKMDNKVEKIIIN